MSNSWSGAACRSLWGPRGISKTAHLWLPVASLIHAAQTSDPRPGLMSIVQCLLASLCFGQVTILANDLTDQRVDRAAGKSRWITTLPLPTAMVLISTLGLLGLLVLIPGFTPGARMIIYSGATALGLCYSVPPLQLKTNGLWGLLAYSSATTLIFVGLPWTSSSRPWSLGALLLLITFFDKWINLHYHQVTDYLVDRAYGINTFAVSIGLVPARRWLLLGARIATLADLFFLGSMLSGLGTGEVITVMGCIGVIMFTLYTGLIGRKIRPTPLEGELPWYYLALTLFTFRLLPVILLMSLAFRHLTSWWIFMLCSGVMLLEVLGLIRAR